VAEIQSSFVKIDQSHDKRWREREVEGGGGGLGGGVGEGEREQEGAGEGAFMNSTFPATLGSVAEIQSSFAKIVPKTFGSFVETKGSFVEGRALSQKSFHLIHMHKIQGSFAKIQGLYNT